MTDHECQDAGSKSRGSDGWCNTAADCKCQSVGATCNPQFSCSFTLAEDAPVSAGGAGGTSAIDGGAALGGASGDSSGGSPASLGGAGPETGGGAGTSAPSTTSAGASNLSAPDGPITGSPSAPEAGGCAISLPKKGARVPVELGFLAAALLFLRRRAAR